MSYGNVGPIDRPMTMSLDSRQALRFGDFVLDVGAYELRDKGRVIRLERQPMEVLILLVERRGQLVSRADIVERLWGPDVFVDVETGIHTAIRKIRRALRDPPDAPKFVDRGHALAKAGRVGEARDLLRTLEAASQQRYVPPYAFALIHAGLGDRDDAFAELDKALEVHDVHLIYLPVDARWDPYRDDPRFKSLLDRCGFMR
jgi:hypothetical protein